MGSLMPDIIQAVFYLQHKAAPDLPPSVGSKLCSVEKSVCYLCRSQPRLVLVDDVMDFPEQIQVDNAAYWTDAFNSDLDFWRNQTAFMRDILGIQLQKVCVLHGLYMAVCCLACI